MEKLCYVLWKRPGASGDALRDALVRDAVPALRARGARSLVLLAADAHAEAVQTARRTRMDDPIAGMLTLWLDCVDAHGAVEALLAPHVARLAGYLVTESVVLPNTTHRAPPGTRTPGTTMLALLEKPERLAFDDWIALWHERHSPLALEIQCTYRYVRNVVARALTPNAPPWRGLVEEGFPTPAVTDPMQWYRAEGDPEKMRDHLGRMIASVRSFLDIEKVESHPLSEYVLG
ncbi:MAG: hypothetical protein DCC71_14700 [Proteobacteria bacterium]|nr:MAG: hypothetical protein DCC71_14700 [Pseudomonadota bacterium]